MGVRCYRDLLHNFGENFLYLFLDFLFLRFVAEQFASSALSAQLRQHRQRGEPLPAVHDLKLAVFGFAKERCAEKDVFAFRDSFRYRLHKRFYVFLFVPNIIALIFGDDIASPFEQLFRSHDLWAQRYTLFAIVNHILLLCFPCPCLSAALIKTGATFRSTPAYSLSAFKISRLFPVVNPKTVHQLHCRNPSIPRLPLLWRQRRFGMRRQHPSRQLRSLTRRLRSSLRRSRRSLRRFRAIPR